MEWFGGRANFIEYHKMQFELHRNGLFVEDLINHT